jgi:hypothetical protein
VRPLRIIRLDDHALVDLAKDLDEHLESTHDAISAVHDSGARHGVGRHQIISRYVARSEILGQRGLHDASQLRQRQIQ